MLGTTSKPTRCVQLVVTTLVSYHFTQWIVHVGTYRTICPQRRWFLIGHFGHIVLVVVRTWCHGWTRVGSNCINQHSVDGWSRCVVALLLRRCGGGSDAGRQSHRLAFAFPARHRRRIGGRSRRRRPCHRNRRRRRNPSCGRCGILGNSIRVLRRRRRRHHKYRGIVKSSDGANHPFCGDSSSWGAAAVGVVGVPPLLGVTIVLAQRTRTKPTTTLPTTHRCCWTILPSATHNATVRRVPVPKPPNASSGLQRHRRGRRPEGRWYPMRWPSVGAAALPSREATINIFFYRHVVHFVVVKTPTKHLPTVFGRNQ